MYILIWVIENQRYGVDLKVIDSVLLACEITHLPNVPSYVLGALNVHGDVVPVIDMRQLLGLTKKQIEIKDHFILAHVHQRQIAFLVDHVQEVKFCIKQDLLIAHEALPNLEAVDYVLKENGWMTLLYNLEKLVPSDVVLISQ